MSSAGVQVAPDEPASMADKPDLIVLEAASRSRGPRIGTRGSAASILGVIVAIAAPALANVFGQVPLTSRAATPAAIVSVYSPSHVRGGLLYTSRFHVTAQTDLRKAQLVLSPGWFEGMQVNSMVPQPVSSGSHNGSARPRSRSPREGRVVHPLDSVPGEPDERRPPLAGRRAHRRRARADAHPSHGHGVPLMDIVIRAAIAFSFVFLLTRVVGRASCRQLEPFDLILLIMMGDLVQQGRDAERLLRDRHLPRGRHDRADDGARVVSELPLQAPAPDPRRRADRDRPGRQADRRQPEARAPHDRRGRAGGADPADRLARRRRVGGPRADGRRSASSRSPARDAVSDGGTGRRAAHAGRRRRRDRRLLPAHGARRRREPPALPAPARARRARGDGGRGPRARLRGREGVLGLSAGRALRRAALPHRRRPSSSP